MAASDPFDVLVWVLSSADSRDDRIVHLLSVDGVHIPAIARRARRDPRRFSTHLAPLTMSQVVLTRRPGQNLAVVQSAQTETSLAALSRDLERYALASAMLETVLALIPEQGQEPDAFPLLSRALARLADPARVPNEDILLLFELRMLTAVGCQPNLDKNVGLPIDAHAVLQQWVAGVWRPLEPRHRPFVARLLEGRIEDAGGRRFKARGFIESMRPGADGV